jgi:PAS domain S-box-containing protein
METEQGLLHENQELRQRLRQLEELLSKANEAEESLKAERHFSFTLLDTVDALVVVLDREGRIIRFNRACEVATGYTFAEVKNKPFWDIFLTPEEIHEVKAVFRELCSGLGPKTHENYWINKEGRLRRIAWSNTALIKEGQVQFVIGTGIDITEREQAERHIARLATFPQLNPSPVIEVDFSGRVTFYNAATLRTLERLGFPEAIEAFFPEDMQAILKEATLETWKDDIYHEVRVGDAVFAESISFPVDMKVARIYAWDISKRKQAEEDLRQSEEKFRLIAETIQDVFWLSNSRLDQIIYVSPAYEELWGRSQESLYASPRSFLEAVHPEDRERVVATISKGHSQGIPWIHEYRLIRPDGSCRWVKDRGFPIKDGQGNLRLVTGVATNITKRKQAEDALKESQQELRRLTYQLLSIQEKERRRIARELHDELGQDLTLLKIKLVAIEDKLTQNQHPLRTECENMLSYIDTIIENVRRLAWDLSPSSLEDLGLSSALRNLVEETCRNHNLQSSVELDEIDYLFSPEVQINIYRIFQESLTNVAKHARASQVLAKISKGKGKVSFMIRDNGRGFNVKQAMSGKVAKKSLGLTAMNERALMARGSLQISSRKGRGTTVAFFIPTAKRGK